jgi:hypothetical protein
MKHHKIIDIEPTCIEYWRRIKIKENIDAAITLSIILGVSSLTVWFVLYG